MWVMQIAVVPFIFMFTTAAICEGNDSGPLDFKLEWGELGTGEGQFSNVPSGIHVHNGRVHVGEVLGSRIQIFDTQGQFLTKFSVPPDTINGNPTYVLDVAIDSSGNVIACASTTPHRIVKFSSGGTLLRSWGGPGTGDGEFDVGGAQGVVVDSQGHIYVSGNDRVQVFDCDGNFLRKWGTNGSSNGQFDLIGHMAVDSSDNIYVLDRENDRVQKFDRLGNFLSAWGSEGNGDGQFMRPAGIAIGPDGDVYVSDNSLNRIQRFTSDGMFRAKWGTTGSDDGQFLASHSLAFDGDGNLYVADVGNQRVQKFGCDSTAVYVSTAPRPLVDGDYVRVSRSGRGFSMIEYGLTSRRLGSIAIYDIHGRRIRSLFRGYLDEGIHHVRWGHLGSESEMVASGVYLVVLDSTESRNVAKLTVVR